MAETLLGETARMEVIGKELSIGGRATGVASTVDMAACAGSSLTGAFGTNSGIGFNGVSYCLGVSAAVVGIVGKTGVEDT